MKKIIYWLPRLLAIVLISFFSVFALDVVGESQWLLAMVMHLIPSFVLIILTIIAWKQEFIGGIFFLAAGVIATIFYHSLIIAAPIFLIGVLFIASKLASKSQN